MRMDMQYSYKEYPLSEKLTGKSRKIGMMTGTPGILGGSLAILLVLYGLTGQMGLALGAAAVAFVVLAAIMPGIRAAKYRELDQEYIQLLRSMGRQ